MTVDALGRAEECTGSSPRVVNSMLALGAADRPTRPSPTGVAAAWLPGAFETASAVSNSVLKKQRARLMRPGQELIPFLVLGPKAGTRVSNPFAGW